MGLLATASCTFDRSSLDGKVECLEDDECPRSSTCVEGECVSEAVADGGEDFGDLGDASVDTAEPHDVRSDIDHDLPAPEDVPQEEAGEDARADVPEADDVGDERSGEDVSADVSGDVGEDGSADVPVLPCGGAETNACGGCEGLPHRRGDSCGTCGTWVCDGADALRCDESAVNACGGCGTLEGTLDGECRDCGHWSCSGLDLLVCVSDDVACDDGDSCSQNDVCLSGQCVGTPSGCSECDDTCVTCGTGCCMEACSWEGCSTCSAGCECTMSCTGESCAASTTVCEAGSACSVVANRYDDEPAFVCQDAACKVSCDHGGDCSLDCQGTSICQLECKAHADGCAVECGDDAQCLLHGAPNKASFTDCAAPVGCGGGWQACNRPCP